MPKDLRVKTVNIALTHSEYETLLDLSLEKKASRSDVLRSLIRQEAMRSQLLPTNGAGTIYIELREGQEK